MSRRRQKRQLSCIVEGAHAVIFVSIETHPRVYELADVIHTEYCSYEGLPLSAVTHLKLWKVCATSTSAFVWLNRGFGLTAQ
jgi:hypothetical protein